MNARGATVSSPFFYFWKDLTMDLLGYYTAGFFLCLIGEPQEYQNCIVYRSPNSFPTEEICHASLVEQGEMLWYMFDQKSFEVVDIRCIEWLPPKKGV